MKLSKRKACPLLPYTIITGSSVCDSIIDIAENKNDIWDFDVYLETKGVNLQRGLVWTLLQKQQLVLSIIKGIAIPPITQVICKEKNYNIEDKRHIKIIDGKQRITTLCSFIKNEFPIVIDNVEYYFKDFDEDLAYRFNHCSITTNIVYHYYDRQMTDDLLIHLFEHVNFLGTPQDEQHLATIKNATK